MSQEARCPKGLAREINDLITLIVEKYYDGEIDWMPGDGLTEVDDLPLDQGSSELLILSLDNVERIHTEYESTTGALVRAETILLELLARLSDIQSIYKTEAI